jgi:hypothetical protein
MPRALDRLATREALLIALFATFLGGARAALRWHVHVPGHAMIATTFGLVLVRSCVDRRTAGTLCGLLAGVVCAALGMGKGGPLVVLKLALPGAAVDLCSARGEGGRAAISVPRGLVIGAVAGAIGFAPLVVVESLANVEPQLIALHALSSASGKALFGAAGGAAGAWVARELRHHGLIGDVPSSARREAAVKEHAQDQP